MDTSENPVSFTVWGIPRGKGRPRMTRSGHAYTDARTRAYETAVKVEATAAMRGRHLFAKGCVVLLEAFFEPPKSLSRKKRVGLLGRPIMKKPDIDNIAKSVIDGMNGAIFFDDSQVWASFSTKRYGETSRVVVTVVECETMRELVEMVGGENAFKI